MSSSSWSCCCCCLLVLLAIAEQASSARQLSENVLEANVRPEESLTVVRAYVPKLAMSNSTKARCRAWMTNVESNNVRGFRNSPAECYPTIKKYIEKGQYLADLALSTSEMWNYVSAIKPDGQNDAIMFDIDETLISTAAIQVVFNYGSLPFNSTLYEFYQDTLTLDALPPSVDLYYKLKAAGWKLILLTGRKEVSRAPTEKNLIAVGYNGWDELILKTPEYNGLTAAVYKSLARVKLEKEKGYSFKSCAGDQYSDCTGEATGERSFKFPNPMYYVA